jgi:hypothetical protein
MSLGPLLLGAILSPPFVACLGEKAGDYQRAKRIAQSRAYGMM